ncbi:cell wall anchor protein [Paenarthrobacter sp. NPDC091669]|uniref:cell wall anchor protein n=1 Tax=Paenarthrobacter sp. NPDC091669 TaxID=3364384 RepID=UPI003808A9E8
MNRTLRKCLIGTCFAGGMIVLSATTANAADTTSGKDGLLSGTQVIAPVTAPISTGATSLGLLGDSAATASAPGTAGGSGHAPAATTNGSNSIGSGTQVVAPVTVPINLGSSSVGLLGGSTAASPATPAAPAAATGSTPAAGTSGSGGIASGTQVVAPVTVPITVGSTSAGVLGDSSATTAPAASAPAPAAPAPAQAPAQATTSGGESIASGAQVVAPIAVPVNIGATAVGVAGESAATSGSSAPAAPAAPAGTSSGASTSGADGVASGTQVVAPITAPVNLGSTSVGVLGDSSATSSGTSGAAAPAGTAGGSTTSGNGGILSGTQLIIPITAPVTVGSTSVGVGGGSTGTVTPPVVAPPVVNPPVVAPPVVNPPVVTPPVVTPPVVTPPSVNPPVGGGLILGGNTDIITAGVGTQAGTVVSLGSTKGAMTAAASTAVGSSNALANTGLNGIAVIWAGAMLLMGLLLAAGSRRKEAVNRR